MEAKLVQRFVKDHNLPIVVFQEPMFSYYIEALDDLLQTKSKWKDFCDYADKFTTVEDLLESQDQLIEDVVNYIKEQDSYIELIDCNAQKRFATKPLVKQGNIFSMNNVGKTFISIDLVEANFQALKCFNKDLVKGCNTYKEFLSTFTTEPHILNAKHLRQVILGQLNGKRISMIQQTIINHIINELLKVIDETLLISTSNDEVVIDITTLDNTKEILNTVSKFDYQLHVKQYILKASSNPKTLGYIQDFGDNTFNIKGCNKIFFMQAYKEYTNQPLVSQDKLFYYEGHLATFLD